jgi:hypothetical protein
MRILSWFRRAAVVAAGLTALASCEKNAVQDITGSLPGAQVKFFHFGVNAPQVHFWANDAKITATTSATGAESTVGIGFGGAGSGGLYSAIAPGAYTFTARITATVDNGLVIARIPGTLAEGKFYSVYLSGAYDATAKSVEGFLLEDPVPPQFDFSTAQVRFVNAIANAPTMSLSLRNTTTSAETAVGGAVAYKAGTALVAVPAGIYDLTVRPTSGPVASFNRLAVTMVPGRVYTISARGDLTVGGTTAVTRPQLDVTANR